MVKALNTHSVGPVIVMMRSGHEPSEMLILAPLCEEWEQSQKGGRRRRRSEEGEREDGKMRKGRKMRTIH